MYQRVSRYYPGYDGTKLAVDLYLPTTQEQVPVIFQLTNGERRAKDTGHPFAKAMMEQEQRQIEYWISHGYAYCKVEPRGVGASYGVSEGFWCPKDGKDMAVLIDTIAAEPWCNGNAGMYGGSNVGASQHLTVVHQPEHLRCIIPCDCSADLYYQNYPNGVSILRSRTYPPVQPQLGIPVDDDPAPDYPMAHEAIAGHVFNMGFLEQYQPDMHRDEINPKIGYAPNMEIPAWEKMDQVRYGHVTNYAYGAWFDPGCTSKILEFKRWGGKLLLGPWGHCGVYQPACDFSEGVFDWQADHLAFFDHHLKGADNDAMRMPPVQYYTIGDEQPWHFAADFPLDTQTNPQLRLSADGALLDAPETAVGTISYKVRDDISIFDSMGRLNRRIQKDLSEENEKCVLFTSAPLEKDLELTGFPVVELYATSTYTDGIFIAELEEVTPDGYCHALTEGMLRGRSAKLGRNPACDVLGLPYHSSLNCDDIELSATKPTLLAFHMEALSRVLKAGSRIRLAVYCGGNGFSQPAGMPDDVSITFHFGGDCDALLRLPVIAPNVTKFDNGEMHVYAFKRAVYRHTKEGWSCHPCKQVYPAADGLHFVTEDFTAVRTRKGHTMTLTIDDAPFSFTGTGQLPDRMTFSEQSYEIVKTVDPRAKRWMRQMPAATYRNLYVATVPCRKEVPGQMNPQAVHTLDLYVDLVLPGGEGPFPCIVHIHGFGGNQHQFEAITPRLLERGYACASIDYRLMPPNVWPSSVEDARGCIRYLKAQAAELQLDPERFGLIGSSMGGHLSTMLAACNGDPACEGDIGGNTEYNCAVKASVSPFAPTDFFTFAEDCAAIWPHQPEKAANGDGPFAPLASMLGWVGPGRGMGNIKQHLFDADPTYQALIERAKDASSCYHVTKHSAPICFVHGIYDYGVQVPMGQSLRMFEAMTHKGVKSLLLCNNNGPYGEDPEIQTAMVEFLCNRV